MSNEVSASSFRVNFSIIKFSPLNNHRHTLQQTLQSEIRGDISPSHNKRRTINVLFESKGELLSGCHRLEEATFDSRDISGFFSSSLFSPRRASHYAESTLELDTVEENIAGGRVSASLPTIEPEISTTPFTTTYPKRKAAVARLTRYSNVTCAAPRAMERSPRAFAWITGNRLSVSVPSPFSFAWISTVNSSSTYPSLSISFPFLRLKVVLRTSFSLYINIFILSFSFYHKAGILCVSLFGAIWRRGFFFFFFLDVGSLKAFQNSFFHIIVSNEFKWYESAFTFSRVDFSSLREKERESGGKFARVVLHGWNYSKGEKSNRGGKILFLGKFVRHFLYHQI